VGVESIFIYAIFPKSFTSFATTLTLRAFCMTLLYIIHQKYYESNKKIQENSEDEIIEESTTVNNPIERITVKVGQKIKVILVTELIYLKAEDDYVVFFTAEGHWLKTGTMKDFETTLPSNKFVRIHRSYIVNIDKITKIERYGQKQQLQLTTGERIRISPNGYKILRTKLNL
jgi:DNA-binding LytR/AlgR family response regulator